MDSIHPGVTGRGGDADAFSIIEFARRNGISRAQVYVEARAGRLIIRKVGVRSIITADDARAWRDSLPKLFESA